MEIINKYAMLMVYACREMAPIMLTAVVALAVYQLIKSIIK